MQIKVPVISETIPVTEDFSRITAVTAHGKNVYYVAGSVIYRYESESKEIKKLFDCGSVNRLAVSPDGRELLVSTYDQPEGMNEAVLKFYDIEKRKLIKTMKNSCLEAGYYKNGIAAAKIKGYTADLVLLEDEKETFE